ncbi:hypothetical protein BC828DRAFT_397812 [Blastocladiella britannica]|nr:hypothetical protein BC828DRAFT_397812 [Blastocladiella britannica]
MPDGGAPHGGSEGNRALSNAADTVRASTISGSSRPQFSRDGLLLPTTAALAAAERRVTQRDWDCVMKTRRTHVHTRTAIAKLASLAVGRVENAGDRFDRDEWRRYAVTQKVVLSEGDSSSSSGGGKVIQMTFCLLYPNESYAEEPTFFLPGHSIEIRLRVPRSVAKARNLPSPYVARFYTPLSGNCTHFTIAVKLHEQGLMSSLLNQLAPEDFRQVQVRGPYGSPLVNPQRPLPVGNGCYDHTLFLCAGTGTTPALQVAAFYFAQTYFPQVVAMAHEGSGANELRAAVRDRVLIKYPLANGWVWATNTRTHTDGYLPLRCLVPWIGRQPRVTVAAAERSLDAIIGRDLLDLVADAYPEQMDVEYLVPSMPPAAAMHGTLAGGASDTSRVGVGRIDRAYIHSLLQRSGLLATANAGGAVKVGVCGPQAFLDACYDAVSEYIDEDKVWLLPAETFLTLSGQAPALIGAEAVDAHLARQPRRSSVPGAAGLAPVTNVGEGGEEDEGDLFLPGMSVRTDPQGSANWFFLPTISAPLPKAVGATGAAPVPAPPAPSQPGPFRPQQQQQQQQQPPPQQQQLQANGGGVFPTLELPPATMRPSIGAPLPAPIAAAVGAPRTSYASAQPSVQQQSQQQQFARPGSYMPPPQQQQQQQYTGTLPNPGPLPAPIIPGGSGGGYGYTPPPNQPFAAAGGGANPRASVVSTSPWPVPPGNSGPPIQVAAGGRPPSGGAYQQQQQQGYGSNGQR